MQYVGENILKGASVTESPRKSQPLLLGSPMRTMRTEFILLILGLWLQVVDAAGNLTGVWGGQGDGTYRNPIVAGDYR